MAAVLEPHRDRDNHPEPFDETDFHPMEQKADRPATAPGRIPLTGAMARRIGDLLAARKRRKT